MIPPRPEQDKPMNAQEFNDWLEAMILAGFVFSMILLFTPFFLLVFFYCTVRTLIEPDQKQRRPPAK